MAKRMMMNYEMIPQVEQALGNVLNGFVFYTHAFNPP